MKLSIAVGSVCLGLSLSSVVAAETDWQIGLGAGGLFSQSIYTGVSNQNQAIPFIFASYGDFYIEGLEVGYQIIESENYALQAAVVQDSLDDERNDSKQLSDLKDVDSATNLRVSGDIYTDFGGFSLGVQQDISNEHDGSQVDVSWFFPLSFDRLNVVPSVSVKWLDKNLVNHYYGVSGSQIQAERSEYLASSEFVTQLDLVMNYQLNEQWSASLIMSYEKFGDEISNSSIVDNDSSASAIAGISYQF